MKTIAAIVGAATVALLAGSAFAADSSDRTSMPESCSDRNANCVIQDGPPHRRGGEVTPTPPRGSAKGDDNKGGADPRGGRSGNTSGGGSR